MVDFARVIELPLAPPGVWSALWDTAKIERCIPGCQDAREVEARRQYRATIHDRVGPYTVEMPIEVAVDELEPGVRLALKATGRDSVLASPVKVSMVAALAAQGAGTSLTLQGKIEVGGKLAALGQGILRKKTRDILGEFAANLERLLKGHDAPAAV
jgi:carbon monoxide dehydrogenase subunit G